MHVFAWPGDIGQRNSANTTNSLQEVTEGLSPFDDGQALGNLRNFGCSFILTIFENLPMVKEALDHGIPLHVSCREVPINGLVLVAYQLGGGL